MFTYLDKVRDEFGTSMLLITHDISVVLESCAQLTVVHAGQVAETGSSIQLHKNPRNPYFILLNDAFPDIESPEDPLSIIEGEPPQLRGEVDHGTFADRRPWAVEEREQGMPPLEPVDKDADGHLASCVRKDENLNAEYQDRGVDAIRTDGGAGLQGESGD